MILLSVVSSLGYAGVPEASSQELSEPLILATEGVTRSFTIPLLQFGNEVVDSLTQTITWQTDGTTVITDNRGNSFSLSIPITQGNFTLFSNSTVIDQRVTGPTLQYDVYWTPVKSKEGMVESYKFTIIGSSIGKSKISFKVDSDENLKLVGERLIAMKSIAKAAENTHSLDPALDWTASPTKGNPDISSIPREPQDLPEGIGLDWSDAKAAGYKVQFDAAISSIEISVDKSFVIDPTTVDSVNVYLSPTSGDYYEGMKRVVVINDVIYVFYRVGSDGDGTANLSYKYSTDYGQTWSSAVSVGTGQIATDRHRWSIMTTTYAGSPQIVLMYWKEAGTNMEFYSQRGTVNSPGSISWSGPRLIGYTAAKGGDCLSGGSCVGVVATTDTNGYVYAAFRWISGGATTYSYRIVRTLDAGYSWQFLFSQVDGVSPNRPIMAITSLASSDILFAYGTYENNKLFYRILDMNAAGGPTWTDPPAELTSTQTGWPLNTMKQLSADSDPVTRTAYIAYVSGGNTGSLKVFKFTNTGTFLKSEPVDSTLSHTLPSITISPESAIHIFSLASNKIYRTDKFDDTWEAPQNPYGTTFTSPNQLTAALWYSGALWTEGSSWPKTIKYGGRVIDLTSVRNKFGTTFEIPGDPGSSNTAEIRYKVSGSATIKIDVRDDATGTVIRTTGELSRTSGTYTWTPSSWTWKSTPDSYRVIAYHKVGSIFVADDIATGFVQADKYAQGTTDAWTPNMYTRALRTPSSLGSDYTNFNFRYWYWDNQDFNPDQGTPRLNMMKNLVGLGGKFVTEFRRAQEGFDFGRWNGNYCLAWGASSNLPNWQVEIEDTGCPENQEEAEIYTHNDLDIAIVIGDDPTSVAAKYGYYSQFDAKRRTPGATVDLTIEFELENATIDPEFDIIEAVKQTEVV